MTPIDLILSHAREPVENGNGWDAFCPFHDDRNRSLGISVADDGKVLVKCRAGCDTKDVVAAMNLTMRDLFPSNGQRKGGGDGMPPCKPANAQTLGFTLAQYAEAKQLPIDFLRGLRLSDFWYMGTPAVRIPYFNESGEEVAVRIRLARTGDNRFKWRKGDKAKQHGIYGLQRLAEARRRGYVILGEGESDWHTLYYHDYPALTIAGADNWNEAWAAYFDGIPIIYVVIEPDAGGEAMLRWLSKSAIRDRARLVRFNGAKDPSDLYLSDLENFRANLQAALDAAEAWTERERAEYEAEATAAWVKCARLAQERDILSHFAQALRRRGVAGEARIAKLLYLALTSRLLEQLVSVAVKGPSSAGKSYLVERVLEFFPET